jgi:outer membrane protein TolC
MEESMRTIPLYILVLVLAAAAVGAQELTLDAAVNTALLNNSEVAAARERAAAAEKRLDGGKSHRMPKIGLSESFVYSNNPAEVFALTLNQGRFDMEEFFMSDPNNPDPLSTFITRVDLELPIYTGGKLSARVGQAEVMATAEDLTLAHAQEKVVFETITAYVNLAKAREHRALLEKARSTTAEHVRLAEKYAEEGVILDADVLQAKVHLSEMDEFLTQATNGAQLAQAALNFQMGADQALPRELSPVPPATPVVGELEDWIEAAVDERRDLEAARRKLEAGRLEEKAARPGYFPEIAVLGNYALYDDKLFLRRQRSQWIGDGGRQNQSTGRRFKHRRARCCSSRDRRLRGRHPPFRRGSAARGPASVAEPRNSPHTPHHRRELVGGGHRGRASPGEPVQAGPRQDD